MFILFDNGTPAPLRYALMGHTVVETIERGWGKLAMEVHFKPDVQAKLDQMARESGRPSDELVEDAVTGYFDELAYTREMLARRFDDLESGEVKPIGGEEAYRRLMEKTEVQRQRHRPA